MKLRHMTDHTLGTVESWYRQGVVTQRQFDVYCHVWTWANPLATSHTLDSYYASKGKEAFWARVERTKARVAKLREGV